MKNLICSSIILLIVSYSSLSMKAQCPPPIHPDYNALISLYNSTNGLNWNYNLAWVDGAAEINCDPCTWLGVVCDEFDRVMYLGLMYNNLNGTVPPEIGELTNLVNLELNDNTIGGFLPAELGQLTNLQMLNFSNNFIVGTIPPEIGALESLWYWYFNWNNLEEKVISRSVLKN